MHAQLETYIARINANDPTLTDIILSGVGPLCISELMNALKNNPNAAKRIELMILHYNDLTEFEIPESFTALQILNLSANKLSEFHIPEQLIALNRLILAGNQLQTIEMPWSLRRRIDLVLNLDLILNPLTDATKIALNAEVALRRNNFKWSEPLPNGEVFTHSMLDQHFEQMLRIKPSDRYNYFDNTKALLMLDLPLPVQVQYRISEYLTTPPSVLRARASMENFKTILNAYYNRREIIGSKEALDSYQDRFDELILATKNDYNKLLEFLGVKIKIARIKLGRNKPS